MRAGRGLVLVVGMAAARAAVRGAALVRIAVAAARAAVAGIPVVALVAAVAGPGMSAVAGARRRPIAAGAAVPGAAVLGRRLALPGVAGATGMGRGWRLRPGVAGAGGAAAREPLGRLRRHCFPRGSRRHAARRAGRYNPALPQRCRTGRSAGGWWRGRRRSRRCGCRSGRAPARGPGDIASASAARCAPCAIWTQ